MMKRYIFLLLLFGFTAMHAQNDIVDWSFELVPSESDTWEVQALAEVSDGWYIYSQHLEEGGPVATSITLELDKLELVGEAKELGEAISGYDDLFGMDIVKYKHEVTFTQEVRIAGEWSQLKGEVYFMVCNDEQCLPPRGVSFSLTKP